MTMTNRQIELVSSFMLALLLEYIVIGAAVFSFLKWGFWDARTLIVVAGTILCWMVRVGQYCIRIGIEVDDDSQNLTK